ncbi:hypothetical protein [Sphingomonas sp.]|uniref:hypothetical protein n=1 Tax=Sphingomonas sp. TaxID=28214 RepID=UPI001B0F136A|nr:hypothetical protein [Sphingomonas sp.]MBO9715158.1 hypothetical protein [Sphingomonas sp.]
MMLDLPPPPPALEEVILHRTSDGEAVRMLGFVAFGDAGDLAKLEAAAQKASLPNSRVEQDDPESMILFPPAQPRAATLDLYHRALKGEFGKLRVELLLVTVKDAADGIDFDSEVRAYVPQAVRED